MNLESESTNTRPMAVLVGARGAGNTTVGRRVAGLLDVQFRDTDLDIAESAGKPVSEIFTEDGEEVFRQMERQAVQEALEAHSGILALGGGAVMDDQTRELLADHHVIWLRVGAADAARRVGLSGARPLLFGNVRGRLVTLLEERMPLYAQVANVTIDTDGRSVDEVVHDVRCAIDGEST
jgi:shikimate kinase